MTAHALPGIGLTGGRAAGEDGWADEMNVNLLRSSVLIQAVVLSRVSSLPGAPNNGDIYVLNSDSTIAFRDVDTWKFITPQQGWRVWSVADAAVLRYMGSGWITDVVSVARGGTGAATVPDARSNLGLGSIATQAANNVAISGGTVAGITDIAVADGGTGASTASAARTNLGLGTIASTASGGQITTTASQIVLVGVDVQFPSINALSLNGSLADAGVLGLLGGGTETNLYVQAPGAVNVRAGGNTVRMTVRPNGIVNLTNVPTYASDSAAGTGGLTTGDLYKSSTGVVSIKL